MLKTFITIVFYCTQLKKKKYVICYLGSVGIRTSFTNVSLLTGLVQDISKPSSSAIKYYSIQ
jgi:hypothetical protein